MSFCEEKPGKSMKKALIHLNIGFVVGILSVLLIYLVASQQTAVSGLNGNEPFVTSSPLFHSSYGKL
jgi:hypothetical protein